MFDDSDLLQTINNVYFLAYIMFLVFYSVLWFFKMSFRFKVLPPNEGSYAFFWTSFALCSVTTMFQFMGNFLSNDSAPPFAFWVNFVYVCCVVVVCTIAVAYTFLVSIRENLPER